VAGYSVVIPARDAARTLGRVLDSLAAQKPAPDEVIVVDDGSTDATASMAAERGARVVSTGGGRSAGGTRNDGWDGRAATRSCSSTPTSCPAPGW
jgi:glycosyltransferase involved in cell wall biosynthesis